MTPDRATSPHRTKGDTCDLIFDELERIELALNDHKNDVVARKPLLEQQQKLKVQLAVVLDPSRRGPHTELIMTERHQKRVKVFWRVEGVSRKAKREEAATWLLKRGVEKTDAVTLCREVRLALQEQQAIPTDHFGLRVEWTADITAYKKRESPKRFLRDWTFFWNWLPRPKAPAPD